MERLAMLTLYSMAKYTVFGIILMIGLARIIYEVLNEKINN